LNVTGATFFGLPVIVVGHNEQIAWSMTLNDTDVFDLFEEKLDPANSRRYVYEREKERMTTNRIKIKVRKGDSSYEVERELLYTHHGPVLKSMEGWAYSARSSVMDIVGTLAQLHAMNKAVDVEEFRRIMTHLELPLFNVMYADRQNELFYVFNARTPQRAGTFDWRSPVPGWASETEWGRILPFERLPQVANPVAGFMQNCNVAPDLITIDSGLNPDDYPQFMGWGTFNDRGRRAMTWLSAHSDITVEEMKRLARDTYLIAAEELKGTILAAYNHSWHEIYDPDGSLAGAIEVLRDWDNRATVDSRGTLLFCIWKTRFDPLILQIPTDQRSDTLVRERLALEALRMAAEFMITTYGSVDVPWGEVHVLVRGEALIPSGGSPPNTSALHTTWSEMGDDGLFRVAGGSAFTMVVDLSSEMKSYSIVPFGSSENSDSPHYSDQAVMNGSGGLKASRLTRDEVYFDITSVDRVPLDIEEAAREAYRAMWKRDQIVVEEADTSGVD
jgi:acyl-homoserine lactone acylase PvdQ